MRAEIQEIRRYDNRLAARVAFYYDEGEEGYLDCLREITPEELALWEKALITLKIVKPYVALFPFNTLSFDVGIGMTKEMLANNIQEKLIQIKEAHERVDTYKDWAGTEIMEK